MKLYYIKESLKALTIFSPKDVLLIEPGFRIPTLYDWEAQGLVKKIRNNNHVFSDYKPFDKDFYFIANRIYAPSYVSLESALNHYGVNPETVPQTFSITTNNREFTLLKKYFH